MGCMPRDEVGRLEWLRLPLHIAIDVRQRRDRNPMPHVGRALTEGLDFLEGFPFAQLRAIGLREELANGLLEVAG